MYKILEIPDDDRDEKLVDIDLHAFDRFPDYFVNDHHCTPCITRNEREFINSDKNHT